MSVFSQTRILRVPSVFQVLSNMKNAKQIRHRREVFTRVSVTSKMKNKSQLSSLKRIVLNSRQYPTSIDLIRSI
jgi:hypothetical protein